MNPVKYNYKADKAEKYVGFIAEEVPELVAMNDRKSLSPMDIVAVLTKVVQEQQKLNRSSRRRSSSRNFKQQQQINEKMKKEIAELKKKRSNQSPGAKPQEAPVTRGFPYEGIPLPPRYVSIRTVTASSRQCSFSGFPAA